MLFSVFLSVILNDSKTAAGAAPAAVCKVTKFQRLAGGEFAQGGDKFAQGVVAGRQLECAAQTGVFLRVVVVGGRHQTGVVADKIVAAGCLFVGGEGKHRLDGGGCAHHEHGVDGALGSGFVALADDGHGLRGVGVCEHGIEAPRLGIPLHPCLDDGEPACGVERGDGCRGGVAGVVDAVGRGLAEHGRKLREIVGSGDTREGFHCCCRHTGVGA